MNNEMFISVVTELRALTTEFPHPIYAVGGCVRDLLLGFDPHDIDIVVDAPNGEQELAQHLTEKFPEKIKNLVQNIKFGTNRFTLIMSDGTEEQIDCAMTRTETYSKGCRKPNDVGYAGVGFDALRRDFTLNALYYDIRTNKVLDPTNKGMEDLKNKLLRTPLDPKETFEEDSLRMMRAIRFKVCKGFNLTKEVVEGIKASAEFISTSARERISEEFSKILLSETPVEGIKDLHDTGLLKFILPEFDNYWGMSLKSIHHFFSFTDHSLEVLRRVSMKSDSLELRMAALLHDISKPTPEGHQVNLDGSWSYKDHSVSSKEMAERICLKRFRFSAAFSKKVGSLVGNHMILRHLWNSSTNTYEASDTETRRVVRILGKNMEDEMLLIDADNLSHNLGYCLPGQVEQFLSRVKSLKIANYDEPIIDGNEVCKLLGIKPGKAVKLFLEVVDTWRDENPELCLNDLNDLVKSKKNFSESLNKLIELQKV